MAPFAPLQHPHKHIRKLGAKLADFAVKQSANLRRLQEDDSDIQLLLAYLTPYTVEVLAPLNSQSGTLFELQLYLNCKVVENLRKLLEGLVSVSIPTRLDDVCKNGLAVYYSAFAALTRIAEQARALATQPEGRAIALKILDQLQPENGKQAPGMPWGLNLTSVRFLRSQCRSLSASSVQGLPSSICMF
jgi:hypothetical protein